MLDLRPARMSDANMLLAWANDSQTRAWSKSTATISLEDHTRWMEFNVSQGYPSHLVMIADGDLGSLGVVRFDADQSDVMCYRASITIAPQHRGRGYGRQVLAMACHLMPEVRIDAEIKPDNLPSRRIFEACGFALVEDSSGLVTYRREPLP